MTTDSLVDRLAAHRTLGSAPREQLEWIAARSTLEQLETGQVIGVKGATPPGLFIVLTGHLAIRVDRGGGPRRAFDWRAGDLAGILPYSRLVGAPGIATAEEPSEILMLPREHFRELTERCHEVTALCVHVMVDRARRFHAVDLHDEKMISLGRLSAGLAHELNNPASAVARSARELSARLFELEASALALGAAHLSLEQLTVLNRVRKQCEGSDANAQLTPMERADREDAVTEWLARHGLRGDVAESVAETPLTIADLETLAASIGDEQLGHALRSVGASHQMRRLVIEVETAARRVHDLVGSVKGFTYMDQSGIRKPVDIRQGLLDTIAVLRSKAKERSVTVTVQAPGDLPQIEGFGGELNQVWSNLIANAIEAAPEGGRVEVQAVRKGHGVAVCVVDDGPGVPEDLHERIFEPFFTTKPQGQGTGLGLDFVRRLVRQHDGEIDLVSRPGHTEFRVTLPGGDAGRATREDRDAEVSDRSAARAGHTGVREGGPGVPVDRIPLPDQR